MLVCTIAAFSQSEGEGKAKHPDEDKSLLQKPLFIEPSPLRYPEIQYPFNTLSGNSTIKGGLMDMNNIGATLLWNRSSKTSLEGGAFILQQYGYTLNSKYTGVGLKMKFNYHFNSKYNLSLWGQYLLNRNNDPFIRIIDNQSKDGIGLSLEYNPNANVKLSIDVSTYDFYSPKKISFQVEGKASFKF